MNLLVKDSCSYRLVCHELQDKSCHLDLFLRKMRSNRLYTYELSEGFGENFAEESNKCGQNTVSLLAADKQSDLITQGLEGGFDSRRIWPAIRKADHRLRYWRYSGPISQGRGVIWELGRGEAFWQRKFAFESPENDYNNFMDGEKITCRFSFSEKLFFKIRI